MQLRSNDSLFLEHPIGKIQQKKTSNLQTIAGFSISIQNITVIADTLGLSRIKLVDKTNLFTWITFLTQIYSYIKINE